MVSAIATILAFIAAGIYVVLTYRQLRLTRRMFEREERPLLRLSAVYSGGPDPVPTIVNMGKGASLTSVIVKDSNAFRFLWTIDGGTRARLETFETTQGTKYSIYYQDVAGRWYLTEATPETHRTRNKFVGVVKASSIPAFVKTEAQIAPH